MASVGARIAHLSVIDRSVLEQRLPAVCEKRYVFDAAPPEGSKGPLHFSPSGECPAHQFDPSIAATVTAYRHQEEVKLANYIARGTLISPPHVGDGGMNRVFMTDLAGSSTDTRGRQPWPASQPEPKSQPVMMASVPMPEPAPLPKEGQLLPQKKLTSIASLLGNLFSAKKQAPPGGRGATGGERRQQCAGGVAWHQYRHGGGAQASPGPRQSANVGL